MGNVQGVIVSKNGYRSGAAQFSNYYGIGLKELRKSNNLDCPGTLETFMNNSTILVKVAVVAAGASFIEMAA